MNQFPNRENVLFAQWQEATGEEKDKYLPLLVRALQQHAYAVCWLKLGQHRPDIVNSAIFRALQNAKTFRGDSKFSTYFHAVVLNHCNSALREIRFRRIEKALDDLSPGEIEQLSDDGGLNAHVLLGEAINELDENERRLISLYREGLLDREIAQLEGTTGNAIKMRRRNIRRKLSKHM